MKQPRNLSIITEIIIEAPAEMVWSVLTDLSAYASWNPFLIKSKGLVKPGERLINTIHTGSTTMTFKPRVQSVRANEYFDWIGHLFIPGLFDGHHYFKIESIHANQVKLIHGENFSGILSAYILRKIGNDTRDGFVKMNHALKARAEHQLS